MLSSSNAARCNGTSSALPIEHGSTANSRPASDVVLQYQLEEGTSRMTVAILLPEEFSRSLSLSLDKRTPVLDLLVYVSSLFRFNPSDYVLGVIDGNQQPCCFRVLRPNSAVGCAGSSILRITRKKKMFPSNEVNSVRCTYIDNDTYAAKTHRIQTLLASHHHHHHQQQQQQHHQPPQHDNDYMSATAFPSTSRREDVQLHVIMPDGKAVLISQPEDMIVGELLLHICERFDYDPNSYCLQSVERRGAEPRQQNRPNIDAETAGNQTRENTEKLLHCNWKIGKCRNRTLHMVPALKACYLAESENTVDRMSQMTSINMQQLAHKTDMPSCHPIPGDNGALKTFAAGTIQQQRQASGGEKDDQASQGNLIDKHRSMNSAGLVTTSRLDKTAAEGSVRSLNNRSQRGMVTSSFSTVNNYLQELPNSYVPAVDLNFQNQTHNQQQAFVFPQGQNSLELRSPRSGKKQRAPKPPGFVQKTHTSRTRDVCTQERGHSVCSKSTMDDISEDFRQAIQIGNCMVQRKEKACQTLSEFTFAEPLYINQMVQTTNEDVHSTDIVHHPYEFHSSDTSPRHTINSGTVVTSTVEQPPGTEPCIPIEIQRQLCTATQCSLLPTATTVTSSTTTTDRIEPFVHSHRGTTVTDRRPLTRKDTSSSPRSIRDVTNNNIKGPTHLCAIIQEMELNSNLFAQRRSSLKNGYKRSLIKDPGYAGSTSVNRIQHQQQNFETANAERKPDDSEDKVCTTRPEYTPVSKADHTVSWLKPKKKGMFGRRVQQGRRSPRAIADIISEHESMQRNNQHNVPSTTIVGATNFSDVTGVDSLLERKPVELEVTEKTTTVQCTVTVEAEGTSIQAVAIRPSSTAISSSDRTTIYTPTPYSKVKEPGFQRIDFSKPKT